MKLVLVNAQQLSLQLDSETIFYSHYHWLEVSELRLFVAKAFCDKKTKFTIHSEPILMNRDIKIITICNFAGRQIQEL